MCTCILVSYVSKAHTHISFCLSYLVHFASDMKIIKTLKTNFFANALRTENQFFLSPLLLLMEGKDSNKQKKSTLYWTVFL